MTKTEIKLIKEQYPFLKGWNDNLAIEIYKKMIGSKSIINEFLHTIDPLITYKQLPDFDFIDTIEGLKNDPHNEDVINQFEFTFKKIDPENLKKLTDFMDKYGWYPSYIAEYGKYGANIHKVFGKTNITIVFEAKYDTEIDVKGSNLYHVTPDFYWDKIERIGLTPKSQSKLANHPGRIYLVKSDEYPELEGSQSDIADLADIIADASSNKDRIEQMYVLQIDPSKLNSKFYYDPNFQMGIGVWTYGNIPPTAIKLIDQIDYYG